MSWDVPNRIGKLLALGWVKDNDVTQVTDGNRGILVLSGNAGCGKTIAACRWLGGGAFLSASKLARIQRYDNETMDKLLSYGRLVIDDLGTEYMDEKGNFMSVLDEVVNDRYANGRPMVITTNLTAQEFKTRYGERIADRIRESGRFISLDGKSQRAQTDDAELDTAYEKLVAEKAVEAKRQRPRSWWEHLPEEEKRELFTPSGAEERERINRARMGNG